MNDFRVTWGYRVSSLFRVWQGYRIIGLKGDRKTGLTILFEFFFGSIKKLENEQFFYNSFQRQKVLKFFNSRVLFIIDFGFVLYLNF